MNEQEMQFANPDWQPPAQPPAQSLVQLSAQEQAAFYSDPTLRAESDQVWDKGSTTYQQGYQAQKRQIAHYQAPLYHGIMGTRRRLWPWLVLTIILICLVPVLLSAMAMLTEKNSTSSTPMHENQTFVGGRHALHGASHAPDTGQIGSQLVLHSYGYDMAQISKVQIDDPTGSIHVHGSMSGQRSQIEALSDNSVPDPLQFVQSNNGTLTIKVNAPTDDNPVLLDITLPQNMALTLSTNGGNIEVDGINGQIDLHTTSSIALSNDTISGQSSIASAQGEVSIVNSVLSGTYVVTSEHGPIALQQVNLSGHGQIQALAEASIMLVGILEPQGNYAFTSAHGEIDLALPSDSAIRLHIDPGTGSANSDFPTQARNGAPLMVKTESGNIQIRQGP